MNICVNLWRSLRGWISNSFLFNNLQTFSLSIIMPKVIYIYALVPNEYNHLFSSLSIKEQHNFFLIFIDMSEKVMDKPMGLNSHLSGNSIVIKMKQMKSVHSCIHTVPNRRWMKMTDIVLIHVWHFSQWISLLPSRYDLWKGIWNVINIISKCYNERGGAEDLWKLVKIWQFWLHP